MTSYSPRILRPGQVLASWRQVPKRIQQRKRRELSPEETHARNLARAWHCGGRYRRKYWVRRPPPRFRPVGVRDQLGVELSRTFYRGYDAETRIIYRRRAASGIGGGGRKA